MQVISKSELLQTLKEIECQMYRSRIDGVGAVSWFSDIVNEQPVIDAAPVVHGRWIWRDGKCFCSACSEQGEPKRVYQDGTVDEYFYCPNCGAKMDLEDK